LHRPGVRGRERPEGAGVCQEPGQPRGGGAQGGRHPDPIAGLGAAPQEGLPGAGHAQDGHVDEEAFRAGHRVATHHLDAVIPGQTKEAVVECFHEGLIEARPEAQGDEGEEGPAPHAADVAQVDRQRLPAQLAGVHQVQAEVDPLHQGVGAGQQAAPRQGEDGGVVPDAPEAARTRRPHLAADAGDQIELSGHQASPLSAWMSPASSAAAARTSSAATTAETTPSPATPVARTWRALPAWIPPMATTGIWTAWTSRASSSRPMGSRYALVGVAKMARVPR